jgi:hypothetical protein
MCNEYWICLDELPPITALEVPKPLFGDSAVTKLLVGLQGL